MGVQGLWELLSPVSRPVTLESLENKILAVDVSIWLNQAIKGIRDKKGQSLPNAHLLSIFHKICKLLFYKIRPVFVFDGSVPLLKKQTLLARQAQRNTAADKAKKASHSILKNYIIRNLKSQKSLPNAGDEQSDEFRDQIQKDVASNIYSTSNDMYSMTSLSTIAVSGNENETHIESESDEETDYMYNDYVMKNFQNPASIDFETDAFKALPLEIQHELLNTVKETHKRRYWTHHEEMPEEYQTFSHYQMNRLLHRRKIQKRLEEVEKDINSNNTASLDAIYKSYANLENENVEARRVMSEDSSHFIFVKHQNKNSDNTEQMETLSLLNSEKGTELIQAEIEQKDSGNPETFPVPSNAAESNEIQENILETSVTCVFSDENKDQEQIYLQNDINIDIKAKDSNPREEFPISPANHISNNVVTVNQVKTNNTSESLIVSSNISASTAEISENTQKYTDGDDSFQKECSQEYIAKEMTAQFVGDESKKREFTKNENDNTYSQDKSICSNRFEKEMYARYEDGTDYITKDSREDQSPIITINITSQQPIDDELFPVDELERTAENVNVQREKETNYSHLWEAQDFNSLTEELETLQKEKQNQERRALTIAEHMYEETKELLKLFGVPYINSPTEAEAQCAKLDVLNLTNGTITDDSDIWLFGGQCVYKNFFSKNKYVEFFKHTDIQSHFNLDQLKLITFAMLTGSDYTQGIQGIGPVTAMEILSEFPEDGIKCLQNFKKWWDDFQKHKELPKNEVCAKLAKFHLDDGFPSEVVYDAYLHPAVDESAERFSWGLPDLDQLREFAQEKFGWDRKKIDDILLPVMKKLNENQLQMRIDSYFEVKLKKEENILPSKRLKKAVKKMHSYGTSVNTNNKRTKTAERIPRRQKRQNSKRPVASSSSSQKQSNKISFLSEESSSDS